MSNGGYFSMSKQSHKSLKRAPNMRKNKTQKMKKQRKTRRMKKSAKKYIKFW
jgi:hypothetical protein